MRELVQRHKVIIILYCKTLCTFVPVPFETQTKTTSPPSHILLVQGGLRWV